MDKQWILRAVRITRWLGLAAALIVLSSIFGLLPIRLVQAQTYQYTITVPSGTAATMGDPTGTVPIMITNDSGSDGSIDYVKLWFDAAFYDVSGGSAIPAGWQITQLKNAGQGQTLIVFETSTAPIAPGESLTFNVIVTGDGGANIPSAGMDQTDQLEDSEVRAGGNTFAAPPSLPSWLRRGLAVSVVAVPPSVAVGEFITVTMVIDNRSMASQSNITSTLTYTPTSLITPTLGPLPTSLTLPSGDSGMITYTYQAATGGIVTFEGSAVNASVTSDEVQSDQVAIGNFTALLEVTPVSIVVGQDVVVRMRVYNNSGGALGAVRPSTLGFVGDASVVSFSGPSPPVVPSLPDGSTTTFEWTYTITGTVASTYAFTGTASAQGPRVTNVASSNSGTISQYSAYVTPPRVGSGTATPLGLVFTVANNGGTTIEKFEFVLPSGFTDSSGSGETIGSVGVPCTWNYDTGSDDFEPAAGSCGSGGLPSGGTAVLTITFSSIPSPDTETEYDFHIDFCSGPKCTKGTGTDRDWEGAVDVPFTITPYRIEMEANPTSLDADGSSASVITATVYIGSNPLPNADVVFATTGTEGTLSAYGGTTDANGVITVTFTSPVAFVDSQATLIATYLTAEGQTTVDLTGIAGPNPQYVGTTLDPVTVQRGETVTFTLDVLNTGNWPITLTTSSTFTFTDGTYNFTATLVAPTTIPTDTQRLLTFTVATVDPNFATGDYNPALHLVGTEPGQTYDRTVSDQVSIVVPPATVQFSSETYSADEGAGTATITVTLNAASSLTVTVDYATIGGGSATAGSDYTVVSGTLTFSPGDTSLTFTVPITDDAEVEESETVSLELSNAYNASLGTPNQATLTIVDDDWPVYLIEARAGNMTIVARVRIERDGPVILSWEILP
jgi:hypothetical protein